MSRYEVLVFLHIAAVVIWLGAGFLLAVLIHAAASDRQKELGYHQEMGWLSTRFFIPVSLSVVILGILLVLDGPYDFDELWINIGLVGYLASFLMGILFFKPEGERIGALVAEQGPNAPELDRRLKRIAMVERVQLTILFLVVADMTFRPTSDDTGMLIGGAAILAAAIALAAAGLRRAPAAA